MTHIRAQHENQPEAKTSQMTLNFMHCKKSENLYGWLEWVCINLKPFSFVEDELTRKYTKLENVSRNTLEKYLHLTATTVEKRIARELPESFALWLMAGLVACYPCPSKDYETALLAFSPLLDETSQSAEQQSATTFSCGGQPSKGIE